MVMIASSIIQTMLTSKFNRYSKVPTELTGAQVAEKMLQENGIHDVKVQCIGGFLTDHYNPTTKTINLSSRVYNSASISAVAVAAHETGHVLQHATGYAPLKFRSAMVPVVTFCDSIVSWVLLLGVLFINVFPQLLWLGIALFAVSTLFSFVTLPVEVNASNRALQWLRESHITNGETSEMAFDALKWAAYTYVIAAIGSLATLLYYIGLSRRD